MSPRIGPPPPLDAQLAARLQAILDNLQTPLTPELIADRRARTVAGSLTDDAIRRGGAFDLHERVVAGPPGAPDVNLLICRPTGTVGPHPVIYNTHGGGMVAGNNRTIELADELDRAQELKIAVVAVDYRLAPEHRHPALTAAPRRLAYTSSKAASTAAFWRSSLLCPLHSLRLPWTRLLRCRTMWVPGQEASLGVTELAPAASRLGVAPLEDAINHNPVPMWVTGSISSAAHPPRRSYRVL
ncbi:MAG TPA: alpha/beta hydrolase fold domain-containing protein [Mycobacterium sp.]|nr:alpha/beta hydrolase fold domain-containing protein [Mycobacterium sp.]